MNSAVSGFREKTFRELPHRNTHTDINRHIYTYTCRHAHRDIHRDTDTH